MHAILLKNGHLRVPVSVTGPGGLVGDATQDIGPTHPDYKRWLPFTVVDEDGNLIAPQDTPRPA